MPNSPIRGGTSARTRASAGPLGLRAGAGAALTIANGRGEGDR
ncbi:hypothetical protein BDZ31_001700 [Conexibacter arvalis]|uniref:Uncharacterized protein n=1 Tax=Conexibacter arvalis TaxID=912552 RepID=A0A840IB34_9ACTN|nr:hypothetical protein [Conexibacter arvalis]